MKKLFTIMSMILISLSIVVAGCSSNQTSSSGTADSQNAGSATSSQNQSNEKIVLRLAHHLAADSTQNKALLQAKEEIESKSDGRLELQLFPASQMGGQREILEGIKLGTIDMGLGDHGYLATYVPEYGLFDLPYLFRDYDHVTAVLNGPVEEQISNQLVEKHGLRHLGWMAAGFRGILTTEEVNDPLSTLKGLKIRVPESDVLLKTFTLLGAAPTPMPFGEVYTGLETKIVDAVEGVPESLYSAKLHEVTKTFINTGHTQVSIGPVISEKVWNKIPEDLQKILVESLQSAMMKSTQEAKAINQQSVEEMREYGITIIEVSEEEMEQMKNMVSSYLEEFAEKVNGQELLRQIIETK